MLKSSEDENNDAFQIRTLQFKDYSEVISADPPI